MILGLFNAISLLLAVLGSLYYGLPLAYVVSARNRLKRRVRRRRAVVLTFDDGPGASLTPAVLSILRRHGCRASFFLLGRKVAGREHIVRQIAEGGHEVCSHGYDHVDHWKVSPFRAIADIKAGWRSLDATLGREGGTYPFRPPGGRLNLASLLYLLWKGVAIYLWTINSGDTSGYLENLSADWCAGEAAAQGGGVLLYHDFDRRRSQTQEYVLASVEAVAGRAGEHGLVCGPLSEL